MYIPHAFKMTKLANQHQFIHEFGFGVIVCCEQTLSATHLPFVLHADEGEQGVLYAHCAKANPVWKSLENKEVLVIFTGPHAYISPSWYAQKPAVPTWDYTAVHAYGKASLLNPQQTLTAIDQVVEQYEPQLLVERSIVTDEIKHKMLAGIVGFKIELTKLEGQLKLGQNKNKADQMGVYNALTSSDNLNSLNNLNNLALANYMKKQNIGVPPMD